MIELGKKPCWKQWNADEAREALGRWRASGQPMSKYERQAGYSEGRLRWWRKRLGEWSNAPVTEDLKLVPVVIRVESARGNGTTVKLHLPCGASLEFNAAQVPAVWVAEVAVEATRSR